MADAYTGYQGFVLINDTWKESNSIWNNTEKTLHGDAHGGKTGAFDSLRFCNWAAPEYGPEGENKWTLAFQAAQLAIATLNALIQGQIADLQEDLAEGYYQQAKYKWDRFEGTYMPLEKSILKEASEEPIKEMDCADDASRAALAVNTAYNYADTHLLNLAQGYRLCLDDSVINQLDYSRTRNLVDTTNYNMRDDQWFVDFKNDQRWARRSNILNLGRNLTSMAMQYGDVARQAAGRVSDIANKAFGSLSQAIGYYGSRFDTFYPTTFLSGQATTPLVTTAYSGTSYTPAGGSGYTIY